MKDETPSHDASSENVEYTTYVQQRIEHGLREAAAGRVLSQEEIEARMNRWLAE